MSTNSAVSLTRCSTWSSSPPPDQPCLVCFRLMLVITCKSNVELYFIIKSVNRPWSNPLCCGPIHRAVVQSTVPWSELPAEVASGDQPSVIQATGRATSSATTNPWPTSEPEKASCLNRLSPSRHTLSSHTGLCALSRRSSSHTRVTSRTPRPCA